MTSLDFAETLATEPLDGLRRYREHRIFRESEKNRPQDAASPLQSHPIVANEEQSDGELVALALHGDDPAFSALMTRHKGWAYQFVRRYVGNSADAYDVLQDTFFAAWRALNRYDSDRPFEFWLRRIALNKCRDRNRREAVRRLIGIRGEDVPDISDSAPGPQQQAEQDQEVRQLEAHIGQLPRSLMEPLLLTALEGMTQEEAGRLLGVSAKSVETKVYRARLRLAEMYGRKR